MTTQHTRTLIQQAAAFIRQNDPHEALGLLRQARTLARDDPALRAEVLLHEGVAQGCLGRHGPALQMARQALALHPGVEGTVRAFAATPPPGAGAALAADLAALITPSPSPPNPRAGSADRRRRLMAAVVPLAVVAIAALAYYRFGTAPSDVASARRLDIERIQENVGVVIVSAEFTLRDGNELVLPITTGSCFAVSQDGLLLTNKHVTETRSTIPDVLFDAGQRTGVLRRWRISVCFGPAGTDPLESRLLYESAYHDVALLKVARSFPRYLRPARRFRPGDTVYAVGFPGKVTELLNEIDPTDFWTRLETRLRQDDLDFTTLHRANSDYQATVTRGVISGNREADGSAWVQHDAVIAAGSSGGPLVTPACRIVGVNTLKHPFSEGFNMALTLEQLRQELAPFLRFN